MLFIVVFRGNATQYEIGLYRNFIVYGGEGGSGFNSVGLNLGKSFNFHKNRRHQFIIEPRVFAGMFYESHSNGESYTNYRYENKILSYGACISFNYGLQAKRSKFLFGLNAGWNEVIGAFGPHIGYFRKISEKWALGVNIMASTYPGSYSESYMIFNLGLSRNLFKQ